MENMTTVTPRQPGRIIKSGKIRGNKTKGGNSKHRRTKEEVERSVLLL